MESYQEVSVATSRNGMLPSEHLISMDALSPEQDIPDNARNSEQQLFSEDCVFGQSLHFEDQWTEYAEASNIRCANVLSNFQSIRERNNFPNSTTSDSCIDLGVNAPGKIVGQRKRKSEDKDDQPEEKKIAKTEHLSLLPIHLFSDAAYKNGISGIAVYAGPEHPLNTAFTSNLKSSQAEVLAAIVALEQTMAWENFRQQQVILSTDSAAIPQYLRKYRRKEKKIGPRTLTNLFNELRGLCMKFDDLEVRHVFSHADNPGNDEADRMARAVIGLEASTSRKEPGTQIKSVFFRRKIPQADFEEQTAFADQKWTVNADGTVTVQQNDDSLPNDIFDQNDMDDIDEDEEMDVNEEEEKLEDDHEVFWLNMMDNDDEV